MISLYLRWLAARRAYSAAQTRDLRAWAAYLAGDRSKRPSPIDGRPVVACDVTHYEVMDAWRKMTAARDAWRAVLED